MSSFAVSPSLSLSFSLETSNPKHFWLCLWFQFFGFVSDFISLVFFHYFWRKGGLDLVLFLIFGFVTLKALHLGFPKFLYFFWYILYTLCFNRHLVCFDPKIMILLHVLCILIFLKLWSALFSFYFMFMFIRWIWSLFFVFSCLF